MQSGLHVLTMNNIRLLSRRFASVKLIDRTLNLGSTSCTLHQCQRLKFPFISRNIHSTSYKCVHQTPVNGKRGSIRSTVREIEQENIFRGTSLGESYVSLTNTAPDGEDTSVASQKDQSITLSKTVGDKAVTPPDEDSNEAIEMYKIISKMDPDAVLNHVMLNHESMNRVQYALAMKRLFRTYTYRQAEEYSKVTNHPGFEVLCSLLALHSQYYKAEICADMLCFMQGFGLDSDHPTMQVYLQLAKYFINDITLDRIVMVATTVSAMTPTEQTDWILRGIRVLIPHRTNKENLQTLTIYELAHLFNMYITVLDEEQRDSLLKCLVYLDKEGISDKYSILLLDGLSKVGSDLQLECPELGYYIVEKLQRFMRKHTLNYEEILVLLKAWGELRLTDRPQLLLDLIYKMTELGAQLNTSEKLRTLKVMKELRVCDKALTEQFLPEVLDHLESLSPEEQMELFEVCSDIDWPQIEVSIRQSAFERCWSFFENIEDDERRTNLSGAMLVMEILANGAEEEAIGDRVAAISRLEEIVGVTPNIKENITRTFSYILPEALDRERWFKEIQVHYKTESGLSIDFLLNEEKTFEGHERKRLAILVTFYNDYHYNTDQLCGPMKCKKYLLEKEGYHVCMVNRFVLLGEHVENRALFLKRHISDTLKGSVIMYRH